MLDIENRELPHWGMEEIIPVEEFWGFFEANLTVNSPDLFDRLILNDHFVEKESGRFIEAWELDVQLRMATNLELEMIGWKEVFDGLQLLKDPVAPSRLLAFLEKAYRNPGSDNLKKVFVLESILRTAPIYDRALKSRERFAPTWNEWNSKKEEELAEVFSTLEEYASRMESVMGSQSHWAGVRLFSLNQPELRYHCLESPPGPPTIENLDVSLLLSNLCAPEIAKTTTFKLGTLPDRSEFLRRFLDTLRKLRPGKELSKQELAHIGELFAGTFRPDDPVWSVYALEPRRRLTCCGGEVFLIRMPWRTAVFQHYLYC